MSKQKIETGKWCLFMGGNYTIYKLLENNRVILNPEIEGEMTETDISSIFIPLTEEDNYGVKVLKYRYFSLKEHLLHADSEMLQNPNQYSAISVNELSKQISDVEICLNMVGVFL